MTLISGEDRKEEPLTLCHISKQNMRYFFSLSLSLSLLFLIPFLEKERQHSFPSELKTSLEGKAMFSQIGEFTISKYPNNMVFNSST